MDWTADVVARCEAMFTRQAKECDDGCKQWIGATMSGLGQYGCVSFFNISTTAHRLAYQLSMRFASVDKALVIRHLCGNSLCVEPSHLTAGNASQNAADKIEHGTSAHGKNAKISIETARAIKISKGSGTQKQRAEQFQVNVSTLRGIDNGYSWAWLGNTPEEDDKNKPSTQTKKNRKRKREPDEQLSEEDLQRVQKYILQRTTNPGSETEHMSWQKAKFKTGYGLAKFSSRTYYAHRLSYMAFNNVGSIPAAMHVRHKCTGDKTCCSPHHLELGTAKQNAADRRRDGTQIRGENSRSAKITEETAHAIIASKGTGTVKERAARFGASTAIVYAIDKSKSWKHLRV